jgi:hypothetical protein
MRRALILAGATTLACCLVWCLALFGLMQRVEVGMRERTLAVSCRPWSMTCDYQLDQHGALENWLFGVAADLHIRKFTPCDYLFNQEQSLAPYPNWLHYIFPIRLCPVGW